MLEEIHQDFSMMVVIFESSMPDVFQSGVLEEKKCVKRIYHK